MFVEKLRSVPLALLLLASVAFAARLLLASQPEAPVTALIHSVVAIVAPPAEAKRAAEKPVPQAPNRLLFYRAGRLTMLDPDGKNEKLVSQDRGKFHPGDARLAPDGKSLAVIIHGERVDDEPPRRLLHVRGLDEKEPGTDLGVECQMFFWSPDGTEIAFSEFVDGREGKLFATHGIVNVKTQEKTTLKLPENHIITDWSGDGKFFGTTAIVGLLAQEKPPYARVYRMNRDGSENEALTGEKSVCSMGVLSRDGSRLLYSEMLFPADAKEPKAPERKMKVLDIASSKSFAVEDLPLNGEIQSYCWSPDGKRIAYSWRERHPGKPEDGQNKETESFLVVCDPNGKKAKTIATEKALGQGLISIGHIDWR